jgi:threonine 3-dehydrogenase
MSGSPAAYADILENTIHGANVALLGIPGEAFAIDWSVVIFNMLTLKGIYGRQMFDTWYKMNVFIESGLDLSPVITHRFGVSEYEEAFAVAGSDESGKVLIIWD